MKGWVLVTTLQDVYLNTKTKSKGQYLGIYLINTLPCISNSLVSNR